MSQLYLCHLVSRSLTGLMKGEYFLRLGAVTIQLYWFSVLAYNTSYRHVRSGILEIAVLCSVVPQKTTIQVPGELKEFVLGQSVGWIRS